MKRKKAHALIHQYLTGLIMYGKKEKKKYKKEYRLIPSGSTRFNITKIKIILDYLKACREQCEV